MKRTIFGLILPLLFTACEEKAMVNVYDKAILDTPIECMKLTVFPEDKAITTIMHSLYSFEDNCPLHLEVNYKEGIQCNSTHNVQVKSMSGFPTSYLKMELRKGLSLKYSYYIDLMEDVTEEDLRRGFERIEKDLKLSK